MVEAGRQANLTDSGSGGPDRRGIGLADLENCARTNPNPGGMTEEDLDTLVEQERQAMWDLTRIHLSARSEG